MSQPHLSTVSIETSFVHAKIVMKEDRFFDDVLVLRTRTHWAVSSLIGRPEEVANGYLPHINSSSWNIVQKRITQVVCM